MEANRICTSDSDPEESIITPDENTGDQPSTDISDTRSDPEPPALASSDETVDSYDSERSIFDSRSPQSSATTSIPPRGEEWDRTLRHIGLRDFGTELDRAARAVFPNNKKSRYSRVHVLLISWKTQDPMLPVQREISSLHEVFDGTYHYEVEEFQIPDYASHAEVSKKINAFVEIGNNSCNDLKIIYYAGHSRLSRTKELVWCTLSENKNSKPSVVMWSGIQRSLEMANSDVLILLDCCSSGVANDSEGNGITELISACPYDTKANGVGDYSFTKALITELRILSSKPCFSVGELYNLIYTRMQSYLPQGVKNERYPPPVHFVLTQDQHFERGIKLSIHDCRLNCSNPAEEGRLKRVRFQDPPDLEGPKGSPAAHVPNKRFCLSQNPDSRIECIVKPWIENAETNLDLHLQNTLPNNTEDDNGNDGQASHEIRAQDDKNSRNCTQRLLACSKDTPRALFAVRFREDIRREDLSVDLFTEWFRSIPAAIEEVSVEAGFKCFSTLLFISVPLSMSSYIPQHPAIFPLGAVMSSIFIPIKNQKNCCVRNTETNSERVSVDGSSKPEAKGASWEFLKQKCQPTTDRKYEETMEPSGGLVDLTTATRMEREPESKLARKLPRNLGRFHEGAWYCDCDCPAIHRAVAGGTKSAIKWYWRCPKSRGKGCGFFLWDKDEGERKAHLENFGIQSPKNPHKNEIAKMDIEIDTHQLGKGLPEFEVSGSAMIYVRNILDKFPNADLKLAQRLGEANWQRHVKIRSGNQLSKVELEVAGAKSVFCDSSVFHDSGLGSSMPSASCYAPSASSFVSKVGDDDIEYFRVPRTPTEVFEGKPFKCFICGQLLTRIKNRVDWKLHVFADIRPYICIMSSCKDALCTFASRNQFADHEINCHSIKSQGLLGNDGFLGRKFKFPGGQDMLDSISTPEDSFSCPLCRKDLGSSKRTYISHLAKHMESIALATLPPDPEDMSGDESDLSDHSDESVQEAEESYFRESTPSLWRNGVPPKLWDNDVLYGITLPITPVDRPESTSPFNMDRLSPLPKIRPLYSQSRELSPDLLGEPWPLPSPIMSSATSSPLRYSASIEGLSPKNLQDFPDFVELPPYMPNSDTRLRKPIGPRPSRVSRDLASRQQTFTGNSEQDNNPQSHFLYHNVSPQADGLYHCPWENKPEANCQHKPEKLKINYDKFVDSHLKPYKCKIPACKDLRFSSTACLLRHEREAHAMHGHGDKPFLCTYEGCERGVTGNGFPRHWNLRDHMKRVHNHREQPPGSKSPPPPSLPSGVPMGKNGKAKKQDNIYVSKATSSGVISQPPEPSLIDRYNMTLLRNATDSLKVMAQTTQRINSAPPRPN